MTPLPRVKNTRRLIPADGKAVQPTDARGFGTAAADQRDPVAAGFV
jgi:hypothetical protein